MGHSISQTAIIHAAPETIWRILMDFAVYPAWNPFILSIQGVGRTGEQLTVTIRPPGSKPETFKPIVQRSDASHFFSWRGSLAIPGLFTGVHSFQLTRQGDSTSFLHAESFSGLLVPVFRTMLARTEEGFQQMNAALKARAEAQ